MLGLRYCLRLELGLELGLELELKLEPRLELKLKLKLEFPCCFSCCCAAGYGGAGEAVRHAGASCPPSSRSQLQLRLPCWHLHYCKVDLLRVAKCFVLASNSAKALARLLHPRPGVLAATSCILPLPLLWAVTSELPSPLNLPRGSSSALRSVDPCCVTEDDDSVSRQPSKLFVA